MKLGTNKRILAGLLACVMMLSGILCGSPLLDYAVAAAEEELEASEMTVYDFTDLTSKSSVTIEEHSDANGNKYGQLLGKDLAENFTVAMKVDTGNITNGEYHLGLCKNSGSNLWDGYGYYFTVKEADGKIQLNAGSEFKGGKTVTIPTEKPYVVEYGVVNLVDEADTVKAKKVFLKINGEEVYAYEDTQMSVSYGTKVNVYTEKCPFTLSTTMREETPTEYDFLDLNSQNNLTIEEHSDANGNKYGQLLGKGLDKNFSVKMKVDTGAVTDGVYYLGLCKNSGANLWDGYGYYFRVNEANGNIQLNAGSEFKGSKTVTIPTEKPYIVEYGIVDLVAGTGTVKAKRVFLKINGAEVFSYEDTQMSVSYGTKLTMFSEVCPITVSSTNGEEVPTQYEFYDLTSEISMTIEEHSEANGNRWGQFIAKGLSENFSVKMKVDTGEATSGNYYLGLAKKTKNNLWDEQGYYITVNLGGNITLEKGSGGRLDSKKVTIPTKEAYTLEYGIVNIVDNDDTLLARKIFVKINDKEVYSYVDKEMEVTCGEYLSICTEVLPITLSTTQNIQPEVLVEEEPIVYDYYHLTLEYSQLYEQGANGYPLGDADDSRKANFATTVQVDSGEATNGAYIFGLCKNAASNMWDGYGYNIRISLSGRITLERGDDYSTLSWKTVTIPSSYQLEYGIVDVFKGEELVGKKIYVKIDGNEVFSYLDKEMEQVIGDRTTFVTEIPVTLTNTLGKKPEELTENVKSVYDFYNLTSEISVHYDNTENGVSFGKGSDILRNNFGVKVQVDTGDAVTGAYIFGLSKNATNNMWDGYGYLLRIDLSGRITLERGSDYEWLSTKKVDIPSSYIIEYGIVDMWNEANILRGKKIYVKIDGEEVFSYLDKEMGQKVGNKATFFSNIPITLTNTRGIKPEVLKENVKSVYDIYNLTSEAVLSYTDTGNGVSFGKGDNILRGNFGVTMKVDTGNATKGAYIFGLCKDVGSNMWDGYGYLLRIDLSGRIALERGSDYEWLSTKKVDIPSSYIIEYGIVDMWNEANILRGKKIYVKIDGVEVFSYLDKEMGQKIGNKATFFTNVPITLTNTRGIKPEVLTSKKAEVYDFFDITQQSSMSIYKSAGYTENGWQIGTGDEKQSGNFAIKMRVDSGDAKAGDYLFGLCKKSAYNMWDQHGYKVRINLGGSIVIKRCSDLEVVGSAKTTIPSSYILEFGISDAYNEQNVLRGKRLYIKIDGVEVLSCIDKQMTENMGTEITAYAGIPIKISTCYPVVKLPVTYVVNGQEVKNCDYVDIIPEVVLGKDTTVTLTKTIDMNEDVKIQGVYRNDVLLSGISLDQATTNYVITNPQKTDKLKIEVKIRKLRTDEAYILDLYDVSGKTEVIVPPGEEYGIGNLAVDKKIYNVNSALRFELEFPKVGASIRINYASNSNILWCTQGAMFDIGTGGYQIKIPQYEYTLASGSTELFGKGQKAIIEIGIVKCYADDVYTYDRLYIKAGKSVDDLQLLAWYDTTMRGVYGTGIIARGPDPSEDKDFIFRTTKNVRSIQDVSTADEQGKLTTYIDAYGKEQLAVYYPKTVVYGEAAAIALYTKEGMKLGALQVGGKTVTSTVMTDGGYLYKIDKVTSNIKFSYSIESDDSLYKVTAGESEHLRILIAEETVKAAGSTEVQIKADKGYDLENVAINGIDYTDVFQYDRKQAAYVATITGIREDKTISASAIAVEEIRPVASDNIAADEDVLSNPVKIALAITGITVVIGVVIAVACMPRLKNRKKEQKSEKE